MEWLFLGQRIFGGVYDEGSDLSSRPQMPVLPFTDAHLSVVHCPVIALPLPCGRRESLQRETKGPRF